MPESGIKTDTRYADEDRRLHGQLEELRQASYAQAGAFVATTHEAEKGRLLSALEEANDAVAAAIRALRLRGEKPRPGVTPEPIEALSGAILMLRSIGRGNGYPALEYHERIHAYEAALDEMRRVDNIGRRNREQIRSMSEQRRRG